MDTCWQLPLWPRSSSMDRMGEQGAWKMHQLYSVNLCQRFRQYCRGYNNGYDAHVRGVEVTVVVAKKVGGRCHVRCGPSVSHHYFSNARTDLIVGRLTAIGVARVIILSKNDSTNNPTCEPPIAIFPKGEHSRRWLLSSDHFLLLMIFVDHIPIDEMEPLNYWSVIECQVAIICACLPATRAIIVHYAPGLIGHISDNASRQDVYSSNTRSRGRSAVNSKLGTISKRVSYSVNTTTQPPAGASESFIKLVEVDSERV